jgi:5-methylcytosine-specific restriction endonuclease McrA
VEKSTESVSHQKILDGKKRYRETHRESILEYHRRWREKNRERYRENARRWRREHPEDVKARYAAMKERRIDALRAKRRSWEIENPEKAREIHRRYRQTHQEAERDRCRHQNGVRRARKHGTKIGPVSWRRIRERDGMVCHLCSGPVRKTEISYDHVIPLSKGGTHTEDNIKVAHWICNVRRGNRLLTVN